MSDDMHQSERRPGDTEPAAPRERARRIRNGVVTLAVSAALTAAGLTACSASGGGDAQVVTRPTEPAAPRPAAPAAGPPSTNQPTAPAAGPAAPRPAAPAAPAAGESASAPLDPPGAEPSEAEPESSESSAAASAPPPAAAAVDSGFPKPEEVSAGPALEWTEVPVDLDEGPYSATELWSLGDGRVVAQTHGEDGDRLSVSGDGTAWTTVRIPEGTRLHGIAVEGDRWVLAASGTPAPDDPGRVLVSDDAGRTWRELTVEALTGAGLPDHCVERSAVQDVLTSGGQVVVLVSAHRFLDLEALLTERGLIEAGTIAHEWRRRGDVLTIRLGDPSDWHRDGEEQTFDVTLDELDLTPEQLRDCDDASEGALRLLAGDGTGVEEVGEYRGWATSAVATRDGFAVVLSGEGGVRRLTSTDGRDWAETPVATGFGTVAGGPDGTVWRGENHNGVYRILRGDIATAPQLVAEFDVLEPVGVLAAGPAGVATAAFLIPDEFREFMSGPSFTKGGYELRMGEPDGGVSLWDLSEGVAVLEFSAKQMQAAESPPEGVSEVVEADGSVTVVFVDPDSGAELVRFTAEDLTPDTDALVAARMELFGPTGVPPIWLGWSADGDRWGWQDAAEGFGLAAGEGIAPAALAVGDDFVLARVNSFDIAEAMEMADSPDAEDSWTGPPSSWRARWFIARVR